jgi:hypothetical protein
VLGPIYIFVLFQGNGPAPLTYQSIDPHPLGKVQLSPIHANQLVHEVYENGSAGEVIGHPLGVVVPTASEPR